MPLLLAEKVKAKVIGQVSEIADQVCDRMLVATSAVLLKNRNGLGGPDDMVGFVGHAFPRFKARPAHQGCESQVVLYFTNDTVSLHGSCWGRLWARGG
jgi:hypothetical protein